jgi:hypothetical protein
MPTREVVSEEGGDQELQADSSFLVSQLRKSPWRELWKREEGADGGRIGAGAKGLTKSPIPTPPKSLYCTLVSTSTTTSS